MSTLIGASQLIFFIHEDVQLHLSGTAKSMFNLQSCERTKSQKGHPRTDNVERGQLELSMVAVLGLLPFAISWVTIHVILVASYIQVKVLGNESNTL